MKEFAVRTIRAEDIQSNFNVAIVVSRFNSDITNKLLEGAIERLHELEFADDQITVVWVPGAVEIPIVAQRLAKDNEYAAIITLGAVVYGETYHFDYVCDQVSQGCQRVALDNDIPVIFGVLTTKSMEQAIERVGGKRGHHGRESADAAYEMVSVLRQIA